MTVLPSNSFDARQGIRPLTPIMDLPSKITATNVIPSRTVILRRLDDRRVSLSVWPLEGSCPRLTGMLSKLSDSQWLENVDGCI